MADETVKVDDRPENNRYEIVVDDQVAYLTYRRKPDHVLLAHTEVPVSLRGQGLGQVLARHAMDEARRTGTHVVVKCPFVTAWLRGHREYDDLVIARVSEDGDVNRQPPTEPR
jgi:predicted GNAT family acetyltransferase